MKKQVGGTVVTTSNSPFETVDQFVLAKVNEISSSASFRSIAYFNDSKTIVYTIQGNRYCANINRQHKSNGVYYVADLLKGCISQRYV